MSIPDKWKEAFGPQIAKASVCDGNYLGELSLEYAVEQMVNSREAMGTAITADAAREFITGRIAEWQKHVGEYLLFYMLYKNVTPGPAMEMKSIWSGDLDDLEKTCVFVNSGHPMPAFREL